MKRNLLLVRTGNPPSTQIKGSKSASNFYKTLTTRDVPAPYAHITKGLQAHLSPAQLQKGHGSYTVPSFFGSMRNYPTETGVGSSTFASRRNFAASSGGVGLI